eukprot:3488217-Pyramimonas_sp.AAC.1
MEAFLAALKQCCSGSLSAAQERFRVSEGVFALRVLNATKDLSARNELYEGPGGNMVDGSPPVPVRQCWRASWHETSRQTF